MLALEHQIGVGTIYGWLHRWRKKRGGASTRAETRTEVKVESVRRTEVVTWENILRAVPDTETLAELLLSGVLQRIDQKNATIIELKAEIKEKDVELTKITQMYNNAKGQKKLSHLTIDSSKHRILKQV